MREILFRGKRVDNGEWETGSLVYARMGTSEEQASIADKMTAYHTPVIPETVGQYTGLTDKNGTRIFEGDILKFYGEDGDEESYTKYEVIWLENGWHAQDVHRLYMADTLSPSSWVKEHFEVIGNIHDNPELLEGE